MSFSTFLYEILSSLVIAVITAIVTVRLSLRRFTHEKWWERKADSYTQIMEALHRMKSYCDGMFNDLASSELLSEEKKIELWQGWQEGIAYLEKSRDIGSFIVLEAANEELKVLLYNLKALKYPEKEGPPWDMFIQQGQVISQTLATLRSIAKQDLGVK